MSVVLNIRAQEEQRRLIDLAARKLGRNRSEFMLEVACREAENVLLDQVYFHLSEEEFTEFKRLLDAPPGENPTLQRLLHKKPAWEK